MIVSLDYTISQKHETIIPSALVNMLASRFEENCISRSLPLKRTADV